MRVILSAVLAVVLCIICGSPAYAHYDGELLPDSVALVEYRMVISINPEDTVTRNKLGMVYIRQEKLVKARKEFMEILDVDPEDFDALDSLGIVSGMEGKYDEAVEWFEKALDARPGDEGAKSRLKEARSKVR